MLTFGNLNNSELYDEAKEVSCNIISRFLTSCPDKFPAKTEYINNIVMTLRIN